MTLARCAETRLAESIWLEAIAWAASDPALVSFFGADARIRNTDLTEGLSIAAPQINVVKLGGELIKTGVGGQVEVAPRTGMFWYLPPDSNYLAAGDNSYIDYVKAFGLWLYSGGSWGIAGGSRPAQTAQIEDPDHRNSRIATMLHYKWSGLKRSPGGGENVVEVLIECELIEDKAGNAR